jgi:hypothetical protein
VSPSLEGLPLLLMARNAPFARILRLSARRSSYWCLILYMGPQVRWTTLRRGEPTERHSEDALIPVSFSSHLIVQRNTQYSLQAIRYTIGVGFCVHCRSGSIFGGSWALHVYLIGVSDLLQPEALSPTPTPWLTAIDPTAVARAQTAALRSVASNGNHGAAAKAAGLVGIRGQEGRHIRLRVAGLPSASANAVCAL